MSCNSQEVGRSGDGECDGWEFLDERKPEDVCRISKKY